MPPKDDAHRQRWVGTPRDIRGDEWTISTLEALAQCNAPGFFPKGDPTKATSSDVFLATPCNPVWDATVPGQFQNWGYFLFGFERGLAWNWWVRYLGLPLFALTFLWHWTKRDFLLSLTGALAITWSPPTQWWDTTVPYLLLYFFSSLVFLRIMAHGRSTRSRSAAAVGLFISLSSFVFVLYPPFQLTLLVPGILLGVETATALPDESRTQQRTFRILLAVVILAWLCEMAIFLRIHAATLDLIRNSAYPGRRTFHGGSVAILSEFLLNRLVSALSVIRHLSDVNPCETSMFPAPFLAAFAGTLVLLRRRFRIVRCLFLAYVVIQLLWVALPWPNWLARAAGLSLVGPQRVATIVGVFAILLALGVLAERQIPPTSNRLCAVLIAACIPIATLVLALSPSLRGKIRPSFLLFLPAALLTAMTWATLRGARWTFAIALLAITALSGPFVHPLAVGADAVTENRFVNVVRQIESQRPGVWLANWHTIGNLIRSTGARCIGGTQQYANLPLWAILDPENRFRPKWDRYTHLEFVLRNVSYTDILNKRDFAYVSISGHAIRDLDVDYFVAWHIPPIQAPFLHLIAEGDDTYIYAVRPPDNPSTGKH